MPTRATSATVFPILIAISLCHMLNDVMQSMLSAIYPMLKADFALIKAELADPHGNLTYRMAARNFNPVMAMAATTTIAQASRIVPLGGIDPEHVVTPGIFVDRVVAVSNPAQEEALNRAEATYP